MAHPATDEHACGGGIGRWFKDPFAALSHWVGAALAVAGLVLLIVWAEPTPRHVVAVAVYGTTLVLLFAASGLAHTVHCSPRVASRFDRFDYAAIFLLIAGTYTPLCLVTLGGAWGWTVLAVEWGLALVGVASVTAWPGCPQRLRVALYLAMGWLGVVAVVPLWSRLTPGELGWLLGGGVAYTVGAAIFATNRPTLWPGRFGAHDLWHVLVLLGSACHFVVIRGAVTG
jgi:hemolysin III